MAFIFHNIYIYMYGMSSFPLANSIIFQRGRSTSNQLNDVTVHRALCVTNDSWGAFGFGSSANTAVALCNVMLLMCRLFGPWFPHRHLASRFFSPLKDGFSLMICETPRFTCAQWFIWIPYWIPYNAKYMRNTVNWHPQFWTIPMCFIFESCVDFFCLGSWGWSTWNVTRKPYVTRCRKVLRACWAICWLGHLLELLLEEMTPNHNRIASARQCILLILLSVKSDSIMLWWFKKWNETRHSEKMVDIWFWELSCSIFFIPTMPRKSARRQAGGGSAKWAAEENITMSYHVSFVENICSCVLFPRLWARISRT